MLLGTNTQMLHKVLALECWRTTGVWTSYGVELACAQMYNQISDLARPFTTIFKMSTSNFQIKNSIHQVNVAYEFVVFSIAKRAQWFFSPVYFLLASFSNALFADAISTAA